MKTLKKALAFALALTLLFTLAACGGSAAPAEAQAPVAAAIDKAAFDALIASGIVADDADIEANAWAAAVKKAGVLRVGGTRTSFLFSQLDETDNSLRGFDAGLYQLLARYIWGDRTGIDTAPAAPAVG